MRDEHCHIIWDVDDGSTTHEESLAMLKAASQAGITEIVATPHMRWDDFNAEHVVNRFMQLRDEAVDMGIQMSLGFEVFYNTLMRQGLGHAPDYTEVDTTNILIEFDTGRSMSEGWDKIFYELQTRYGLDITLAHPERYTTVLNDFDTVYRLKDMGIRIQVSAGDLFHKAPLLSKSPLRGMAKCAQRIIDEGLCDALVSDAHRPTHYDAFSRAVSEYEWRGSASNNE